MVDYIKGLDAMVRVTPRLVTEKLNEGEVPRVMHHALEAELQNNAQNSQYINTPPQKSNDTDRDKPQKEQHPHLHTFA
jgi:hypothetical protein